MVWKVMNEYAQNNWDFNLVKEFKETWSKIAHTLDRVNDDFNVLKSFLLIWLGI